MARVERIMLVATRGLSAAGLLVLMFLAAMTILDGLMRWIAGEPIAGVRDLASLTIAVAVACCLPVGLAERGNVTIRIADKLGTVVGSILGLFAELVVLGVMIIMARQFYLHAAAIARDGETTWVLRLPTAPFWFIVDAILWSAVIVQIAIVVIDGHRFVRGPRS